MANFSSYLPINVVTQRCLHILQRVIYSGSAHFSDFQILRIFALNFGEAIKRFFAALSAVPKNQKIDTNERSKKHKKNYPSLRSIQKSVVWNFFSQP